MTRRSALAYIALLLASLAIPAQAATAGFHQSYRWVDEAGELIGQGLMVREHDERGSVKRVLVQPPGGDRLIFNITYSARSGCIQVRVADDESGWWSELLLEMGTIANDYPSFLEQLLELGDRQPSVESVTFTASGGARVELAGAPAFESLNRELPSLLAARGACAVGLDGAPAHLGRTLGSLAPDSSAGPAERLAEYSARKLGFEAALLVDTLNSCLDREEGAAQPAWRVVEGPPRPGIEISDPSVRAFVEGFRSIEGASPLSGHRASRVLARQNQFCPHR